MIWPRRNNFYADKRIYKGTRKSGTEKTKYTSPITDTNSSDKVKWWNTSNRLGWVRACWVQDTTRQTATVTAPSLPAPASTRKSNSKTEKKYVNKIMKATPMAELYDISFIHWVDIATPPTMLSLHRIPQRQRL